MTNKNESWERKGTPAQQAYWDSLKLKRGKDASNWKGDGRVRKETYHQYLVSNYGNPNTCEDENCSGRSKWFDWALKKGRQYSHNRDDYLRLCRSCHRRYDLTPEKRKQAIKNLIKYNPYAKNPYKIVE